MNTGEVGPGATSDSGAETERTTSRGRRKGFAEQELRLISALVVLIGLGLFFAMPFVLSIGSVVFLPITAALVLTIILSPLADRLAAWGLPNVLASFIALLIFLGVLLLALALILQPATVLFDRLPTMIDTAGARFSDLRNQFGWIA